MDKQQDPFVQSLIGRTLSGWRIKSYIDSGKSAHVFEGRQGRKKAAVKVFDPELVDRYGRDTQIERIRRELSLIGKQHPHLIRILGGRADKRSKLLYIIMEYLPGKNLADRLSEVPETAIRRLIRQVASAARFLEDLQIIHRDIKPSNIVVSDDFSKATLLDLGVIQPVGLARLTDVEGRRFVGTLQYASPEFLFRREDGSLDMWRATTFYQLGGVLHDLLTKRPLFQDYSEPYAALVDAVRSVAPQVAGGDLELVDLAENCLLKDAKTRLSLVSWESFSGLADTKGAAPVKKALQNRKLKNRLRVEESREETNLEEVIGAAEEAVRSRLISDKALPPFEVIHLNQGRVGFGLRFYPSVVFNISEGFQILFGFSADSKGEGIVQVTGETSNPHATGKSSKPLRVFSGKHTSKSVVEKLVEYVYEVFQGTSLSEGKGI